MLPTLLLTVVSIAAPPPIHPIIEQAYKTEQAYVKEQEEIRKAQEAAAAEARKQEALQLEISRCSYYSATPDWLKKALAENVPSCRTRHLLSIMSYVESTNNPTAKNKTSSASGLFQFLDSTWRRHGCGDNKLDPIQQIRCAARIVEQGGFKGNWYKWWPQSKQRLVPRNLL